MNLITRNEDKLNPVKTIATLFALFYCNVERIYIFWASRLRGGYEMYLKKAVTEIKIAAVHIAAVTFVVVLICISFALPSHAASNISVVVDNNLVVFDTQPIVENGRTLVPLRAIAEAAGMDVAYNEADRSIMITKTEKLMKIPLDPIDTYIIGKTHVVKLTLGNNEALVNGKIMRLEVPAKTIDGRTVVPLRFISDAMDMDVIWSPTGLGVLNKKPGVLIGTRLRGSAPLAGEGIFPSVSTEIISVVNDKGGSVALGMDVTEMQRSFGDPVFAWGRGVPSPQMRYEYGDNISSVAEIGNAYAEIGCTLGKVTVIQLGPGSGSLFKTGAGIAVGEPASSITKFYAGSELYLKEFISNGHILLVYSGNTLKYALSQSDASMADYSKSDVTHVLDFNISNDIIEAIAIADVATARELSGGS
jgi:hypothetical protein